MNKVKTIVKVIFLGILMITVQSCFCVECELIDDDGILSEVGDECDADFVDYCQEMNRLYSDVHCTCN